MASPHYPVPNKELILIPAPPVILVTPNCVRSDCALDPSIPKLE